MTKICSEKGCERESTARGLCSMHYQRARREEGPPGVQVGRPRKYPEGVGDKHGGAPRISVRLDPEAYEWVRSQGGGAWLRHVSQTLWALVDDEDFSVWWARLALPENSVVEVDE